MGSGLGGASTSSFSFSKEWLLVAAATLIICGFLGYVIYEAVMATASEVVQRLLVISPLVLIIAVHWLSAGSSHFSTAMPGSEPQSILRAGASAWGLSFLLVLLFFLISHQPSLFTISF